MKGGFAVTAIGRDQPGIVAAISGVFADLGANIEDARMTILRGNFAVMLIAALPEGADQAQLEARLGEVKDRLGLEAVAVNRVEVDERPPHPTHTLTVYGADHPGIVHAISAALAERAVNITDLQARLTVSGKRPVYTMTMELELPSRADPEELRTALVAVGSDVGVDVSLGGLGNAPL